MRLLVATLTEDELDRLGDLLRGWPAGARLAAAAGAVRACLDRVEER